MDMFDEVQRRGSITPSQGNALIRLVPKFPDPVKPADYRPISLLNCDYKIMAGTYAGRLKRSLESTLGPSQRGGVSGRRITDNLNLYRDAIAYLEERTETESESLGRDPRSPAGAVIVDSSPGSTGTSLGYPWNIPKMERGFSIYHP